MPPSGSTTHLNEASLAALYIGKLGLGCNALSHAGCPSVSHCPTVATSQSGAHFFLWAVIHSDWHFQMRWLKLPTGAFVICSAVASTLRLALSRVVASCCFVFPLILVRLAVLAPTFAS